MHQTQSKPNLSKQTYLQRLLESFAIPSYRWLWGNSLLGTTRLIVVFVVRGWLVLEMTGSPFWVGLAPALRGITQISLGAFSGVLLDRFNRKYLLLLSEIGNSLVALLIGILVFTDLIELWHILAASVVEGVFISFRWPAINTILYDTVGPDRVLNASATHLQGFNLGSMIAPAVAGILIETYGISSGYFFATIYGLIGSVCVYFIQGEFRPKEKTGESLKKSLHSGLLYAWTNRPLRLILTLSFTMSLLGWSHISMMPIMARDVLGVNATGLGFLTTAGGIGAIITTSIVAGLGNHRDKIRLAMFSATATAILIVLFSLSKQYTLSLLLKAVLQGSLMSFEATISAIVLLLTSDRMQGRVQGIYALIFGFTWLGGVVLGGIATISSAPIAIGLGGIIIGLVTILYWKPIQSNEFRTHFSRTDQR